MPLNKRKNNSKRTKIIIWALIAALVVLMIISFPATQHVTEIILYP